MENKRITDASATSLVAILGDVEDRSDDARLDALASFEADSLEDDPELLALVGFAARLCGVEVAQISLVERYRQLFLAGQGLDVRETPRELSFCAHAMRGEGLMEVREARENPVFADNALVTGAPFVRFYAGQPLVSEEGEPLGALCVISSEPRPGGLDAMQRQGLGVLAQAVMRRLAGHRESIRAQRDLAQREEQLRALADAMPAVVFSADAEGRFDYFNQAMIELVGHHEADGSAVHPDDREQVQASWEHSLATGDDYEAQHRLMCRDGSARWMLARARPVRDRLGKVTRWFGTAVDIDEMQRLSEARDLLSRELAHRIKNIFAVVIGLISLEARRRPEHRDFAAELTETLRALNRAHDFVRPSGSDTRDSLRGLLDVLFAPYGTGGEALVRVSGADSPIAARAATPLALVFHELATNSAKYGALSAEGGYVTLDVVDAGETLQLLWREHGGPVPVAPAAPVAGAGAATDPATGVVASTGFGSRLVEMSVTGQLGGSWVRRFEPGGLEVELTVSKRAIDL